MKKNFVLTLFFIAFLFITDAKADNKQFYNYWTTNLSLHINQEVDIPFPPMLLQAIVLRIQNMGNPEGEEAAQMLDYAVAGLGLKRLAVEESQWVYGRDVTLKTVDQGFEYEFHNTDAFALLVSNTHIASAELVFKNKSWVNSYKKAIELLDYMEVPYLHGKDGMYMRLGSHNSYCIEMGEVSNVSFNSKYFEEPAELSPYDVIAALGQPSDDLRELAKYREYVTADEPLTKTEGNTNVWYLSQGCKLSINSSGVLKVDRNTSAEYEPMSYVNIVEKDNVITDLFFVSYGGNEREFVEALIAFRFMPMEDTRVTPAGFDSGYAMTFKDPDQAKADLRIDKDENVYLHLTK